MLKLAYLACDVAKPVPTWPQNRACSDRNTRTVQIASGVRAPLAPLRHAELATAPPLQSGTYGSGGSRCITIMRRGRDH